MRKITQGTGKYMLTGLLNKKRNHYGKAERTQACRRVKPTWI